MEKINYKLLFAILLMMVMIATRIAAPLSSSFALLANFSSLGAIALFGSRYIENKVGAYLLPLLILAISDFGLSLVMGKEYVFYPGWHYTYIAFVLMVLAGRLIIKNINLANLLLASLVATFIHWIVTDFGVWYGYNFYPNTLLGFWQCLVAAIPFELKFLTGTLVFTAVMFGAFEMLKYKFPLLGFEKKSAVN